MTSHQKCYQGISRKIHSNLLYTIFPVSVWTLEADFEKYGPYYVVNKDHIIWSLYGPYKTVPEIPVVWLHVGGKYSEMSASDTLTLTIDGVEHLVNERHLRHTHLLS